MFFVLLAAAILALFVLFGLYFSFRVLHVRRSSTETTIADALEKGETNLEFVEGSKEAFEVTGSRGARIRGFALPGTADKTIVFCHGISWTRWGMVKYFDWFKARGWNIVAYDHRAHGESSGPYPTYGLLEKEDLARVMGWTRDRFPNTPVGLFGESMGAATVLQYAPMDDNLAFIVADCPFYDFDSIMRHQLGLNHVPRTFRGAVMAFLYTYLHLRTGMDFRQVSPAAAISTSDVPLLLVHGAADAYVPTRMSVAIHAERSRIAPTELLVVDEAKHAKSMTQDRALYHRALDEFLGLPGRYR